MSSSNLNTRDHKYKRIEKGVYMTKFDDLEIIVKRNGIEKGDRKWVASCGDEVVIEKFKNTAVDSIILRIKGI